MMGILPGSRHQVGRRWRQHLPRWRQDGPGWRQLEPRDRQVLIFKRFLIQKPIQNL